MSTYINIKWEKKRYVYTCTSCKLGDIYTNAYIHLCACVRVCIHRHVYMHSGAVSAKSCVGRGTSGFRWLRFFREILHLCWRRNLPKFWSQMTETCVHMRYRAVDDENILSGDAEGETSKRDQFLEVVRAGVRGFSFSTLLTNVATIRLLTDNQD